METTKFYRYWIQIIILLTFFQYGLYYYVHQISFLNEFDDFLIVLLFLHLLFRKNGKKSISRNKSKYTLIFTALLLVALASTVVNQTSIVNFLLGIKSYFLYFIFFYCIYWINFNANETEQIIKFSLNLFFIELLVALIQFASGIMNHNLTADSIMGTFNGPNLFGYAIFVLLYFSLYRFYFDKKKEYFKYVIILLILLLMSSARFAILLFPLVFIVLNPVRLFSKINLQRIIFILLIILLVPIFVNNSFILNSKIQDYFSLSFVKEHFSVTEFRVSSGSARNLWYPLTKEYLEEYAPSPLLGFGPGMYASFTAMRLMPSTNLLIYDYFDQTKLGLDPEIDSQIIPIWGELGYLGIVIFYILLIFMLIRMIIINRKVNDPLLKAISSTATAYCIFFIFGFYIYHILESQTTAILLFLFVGLSEAQYRIIKNNKSKIRTLEKKNENTPN